MPPIFISRGIFKVISLLDSFSEFHEDALGKPAFFFFWCTFFPFRELRRTIFGYPPVEYSGIFPPDYIRIPPGGTISSRRHGLFFPFPELGFSEWLPSRVDDPFDEVKSTNLLFYSSCKRFLPSHCVFHRLPPSIPPVPFRRGLFCSFFLELLDAVCTSLTWSPLFQPTSGPSKLSQVFTFSQSDSVWFSLVLFPKVLLFLHFIPAKGQIRKCKPQMRLPPKMFRHQDPKIIQGVQGNHPQNDPTPWSRFRARRAPLGQEKGQFCLW